METGKKKLKKNVVIGGIVGIVLLVIIAVLIIMNVTKKNTTDQVQETTQEEQVAASDVKIINVNSNSRPYAVMINNHPTARPLQSGLQNAYIIYEMIVEGGLTRYMALFKDVDVSRIGSVRSSRHYFLDYAMENDALYVHWGYSDYAKDDISTYGINNLNGLVYGYEPYFTTDTSLGVSVEHTRFTSTDGIKALASKLGYRTTTDEKSLLTYSVDSINLSEKSGAQEAKSVSIKYSGSVTSSYVYNEETKTYDRSVNGKAHTDYVTKEQYTFKNIITYQVKNNTISGDSKGRQNLEDVGSGTGYYISEGYAVPINWSKDSRSAKTKYTYADGTELVVNDGNTFIQIQPAGQALTIE